MTPPAVRHFILATAGHVDHGKSALVRALTGVDPDRLPEEKKRGITIDLGFAQLDLASPADPTQVFRLGVVDVPGHEDFVKNMLAGVGAADAALLVVAADDGWMPQTEEHARILQYLGVSRAVIALTKIDLLASDAARVEAIAHVRERLAGTPFANAPIVPTSTLSSEGLDALRGQLARTLAEAPPPADIGKPRLALDRVFTVRGVGTVVTGTLTGSPMNRGQMVVVQPGGGTARVRGIQSHRRETERALPGSRTALNLPDLPADPEAPGAPRRGDTVTLAEFGVASATLDALIFRVAPRSLQTGGAAPEPPLKNGAAAHLHLGSGRHLARVHLLDGAVLAAGERGLAQVRFEAPVFAFAGDRFVVRDDAGQHTLAGGIVLDPDATRRGWRQPARRKFLARRASAVNDAAVFLETLLARDACLPRAGLLVKSNFRAAEIDATLQTLAGAGRAFITETLAADGVWWEALRARAAQRIDEQHRAHPELPGFPVAQLTAQLGADIRAARRSAVFEALTRDLSTRGFAMAAGNIRRMAHRPALPDRLQSAGERVRAALLDKPLEPPSRAALAPDSATQAALRFLLETGEAVELGPEIVLLAGSFARMRAGVLRRLRERGPLTASELRQGLGTTRRILVPLLERLDSDGLTRREGDRRVLRESAAPVDRAPV